MSSGELGRCSMSSTLLTFHLLPSATWPSFSLFIVQVVADKKGEGEKQIITVIVMAFSQTQEVLSGSGSIPASPRIGVPWGAGWCLTSFPFPSVCEWVNVRHNLCEVPWIKVL